ncbi:MAG: glycosyltransferase family 2 protein [Elusimicrobiota bacterium]
MPQSNSLSIIIIALNEEKDIEACLESVKNLSDDIVLVDSGSTDRTVELAKKFTSKIFHHVWTGYGPQKQFALEKTAGSWVLNIDADERVTPELAEEIKRSLNEKEEKKSGFLIPFKHIFLGHELRFGGCGGERHLRLFQKEKSVYGQTVVHEGISVQGEIGSLKNHIVHFSYHNIEDYLKKCNGYTSLIAKQKWEKGQRFYIWHHFRLPFEFLKRYFFKMGLLDGSSGFIYALLSSYYVWLKFIKLKDLEEHRS